MGSRGIASYNESDKRPPTKKSMPTRFVQGFRELLTEALDTVDPASSKKLNKCIGVYAFYDYDGEPIYVGQTREDFGTRIGRHLRGQRSDTLAYRILDPFEVADVELYPIEDLRTDPDRKSKLDAIEYSVYVNAIKNSKYQAILNEKIPPRLNARRLARVIPFRSHTPGHA
ncbi:MAG: GIY-YIG nuclease family protein [Aeromicrobium sp.]|uniref:GIY-YIG nuclease family protein n=1 Tax=Aeromicrobium sp. TaxID=1871063 RepID=UPI0039E2BDB2